LPKKRGQTIQALLRKRKAVKAWDLRCQFLKVIPILKELANAAQAPDLMTDNSKPHEETPEETRKRWLALFNRELAIKERGH